MAGIVSGSYHIMRERAGWCVARFVGYGADGELRFRRVSNSYKFRGWAQAFARRMNIRVHNYVGLSY